MRYAHGIVFSALISGIIFNGAAIIKMMGYGVSDSAVLQRIWRIYTIWTIVSLIIMILPILFVYYRWREALREILIFELGGLAFFSPLWLILDIELTGDFIIDILLFGVENALPIFGPEGEIVGLNLGPVILIPLLIGSFLIGIFLLRPNFVNQFSLAGKMADFDEIEVSDVGQESSEDVQDLPDVTRPAQDETVTEEMRTTLREIGISEKTVQSIIDAGLTGVTDLLSSSPKNLARLARIEESEADDLLIKLQKRVWGARV
ncbi:MAG: hypothetical protein R6V83_01935 [Candidatus Thorarchaeota archaeon]